MIQDLTFKNQAIIKNRIKNFVLASAAGFTLIELMVVISIMAILSVALTINLAGQRGPRDLRIAQNELVTNIRLIQSNVLSARSLDSGENAQYYALKFDLTKPGQYVIQAIYNADTGSPLLRDIQTITLPANIQLAAVSPVTINRALTGNLPIQQNPATCALIVFTAPFGKPLFNNGCALINNTTNLPNLHTVIDTNLSDKDDYGNIFNFIANSSCPGTNTLCNVSADSIMTIKLTDKANTISKSITVNGVTGAVGFSDVASGQGSGPTASLTIDGLHNETVAANQSVVYSWSSANANQWTATYTVNTADTCGTIPGQINIWSTANGSSGGTSSIPLPKIYACQAGHIYTITYTATNTNTGQSSSDSIVLTVTP